MAEKMYLYAIGAWSNHSMWRDPKTGEFRETLEQGVHQEPLLLEVVEVEPVAFLQKTLTS